MENRNLIVLFLCLIGMQLSIPASCLAQCTNQLTHITGSQIVAGVNVTVTTAGNTCWWNTYCPTVTSPYFIGYAPGPGSGPGSFTFTFSPPINGIRLNFGGASCGPSDCEEVRLYINGAHYPMASIGTNNACDAMASLTGAGDLRGCPGCGVSGWSGTSITGFPISTLTVEDFVLMGFPNGSLFSLWICPAILPVEWLQFTAQLQADRSVNLDWTTAVEINCDFFTVERSQDGQSWEALARIDAAGNSDIPQSYSFVDPTPMVGQNHYRIQQTSLDGASSPSQVEILEIAATTGIRISPNPVGARLNVEMAGIEKARVRVLNPLGQEVELPILISQNQLTFETTSLVSGIYFVEVRLGNKVFSEKVVVE